MKTNSILSVESVVTKFGNQVVHDNITFELNRGCVVSLIGGSGCGKSTLLREILGLLKPTSGEIFLFGKNIKNIKNKEQHLIKSRYGVLFQNSALFSSLNVKENIALPLVENTNLSKKIINEIVKLRLLMVGLDINVSNKMPSELSGGMKKRVSLARALSLEPEILFLDEPTSGLDPISARSFDKLIKSLNQNLGLSVLMVTHDLDSICSVSDRVIVLGNSKIMADGTVDEVRKNEYQWIKDYFGTRENI